MTRLQKDQLIIVILLIFGLIGGFLFGQMEENTLVKWGLKAQSVRLLIEKSALLPGNLRLLLEKESGYRLEVRSYDSRQQLNEMAPFFDIIIGPHCDLKSLRGTAEDLRPLLPRHLELSADFQAINEVDSADLPVLWRYRGGKDFNLYSIKIKRTEKPDARVAQVLGQFLTKDFLQTWSETTDLATTFSDLEETSLEPELKSSALRKIPLQNLISIKPLSCSN